MLENYTYHAYIYIVALLENNLPLNFYGKNTKFCVKVFCHPYYFKEKYVSAEHYLVKEIMMKCLVYSQYAWM